MKKKIILFICMLTFGITSNTKAMNAAATDFLAVFYKGLMSPFTPLCIAALTDNEYAGERETTHSVSMKQQMEFYDRAVRWIQKEYSHKIACHLARAVSFFPERKIRETDVKAEDIALAKQLLHKDYKGDDLACYVAQCIQCASNAWPSAPSLKKLISK